MVSRFPKVLAVLAVLAAATASPATAHFPRPSKSVPSMSLTARADYYLRVHRHAAYVASAGRGRPARAHRRLDRWALRNLRTAPEPWETLASECETPPHGDWDYNGPSGFDGGVQFHPSTWRAHRRPSEPAFAWQAFPLVQAAVAARVLAEDGWGAWPDCSLRLGFR